MAFDSLTVTVEMTRKQYDLVKLALRHLPYGTAPQSQCNEARDIAAAMEAGADLPWDRVNITMAPNASYATATPTFEG